ncbi:hypothetical protein HPG69_003326 [Diceros bicornis minor]|uniref:Uncharacterized protein n=1 Tax=Diceros bicornis minor TaxID=77932 RepID=A0A7J7E8D7_DICBM|nr:hypothetical protein HPG69_003326 [Diceros bicornis minor]
MATTQWVIEGVTGWCTGFISQKVVQSGPKLWDIDFLSFKLQTTLATSRLTGNVGKVTPKTNQKPKRANQDLPELKVKLCQEEGHPGWGFVAEFLLGMMLQNHLTFRRGFRHCFGKSERANIVIRIDNNSTPWRTRSSLTTLPITSFALAQNISAKHDTHNAKKNKYTEVSEGQDFRLPGKNYRRKWGRLGWSGSGSEVQAARVKSLTLEKS